MGKREGKGRGGLGEDMYDGMDFDFPFLFTSSIFLS